MNDIKPKPDIRERTLERGIHYPSDAELIMLILGSGNKNQPVELLAEKMCEAIDLRPHGDLLPELLKIKGVGVSKALAVAASIELGRRKTQHLRCVITQPKDLIPFVRHYALKSKEHFISVLLSGAHEIIDLKVISVGSATRTIVNHSELLCDALKAKASSIIVCHNHPSGNCAPSREDLATTKKLLDSCALIGITLLDHIIISTDSYFSFTENGLLEQSAENPLNIKVAD